MDIKQDDILNAILEIMITTDDKPMDIRSEFALNERFIHDDPLERVSKQKESTTLTFGYFWDDVFTKNLLSPLFGINLINNIYRFGDEVRETSYEQKVSGSIRVIENNYIRTLVEQNFTDIPSFGIRSQEIKEEIVKKTQLKKEISQNVRETIVTLQDNNTIKIQDILDLSGSLPKRSFKVSIHQTAPNPDLYKLISYVQELMYQSRIPITFELRRTIAASFNNMFTERKFNLQPYALYDKYLPKPYNLKLEDLLFESSVMIKYDGLRKQFLSTPEGTYLLTPPYDISILSEKGKDDFTLLDGELVGNIYYPFDISFDNGSDVRRRDLNSRLGLLNSCVKRLADPDHNITFGKTEIFKDITFAMVSVSKDLPKNSSLWDISDGIIFVSPGQYSSIRRKWKPKDKLTIDFIVENEIPKVVENNSLVPFLGSDAYPFDKPPKVIFDFDVAPYAVVECLWNDNDNAFHSYRIRIDKDKPNSLLVAKDIWNNIQEPILETDLTDRTFGTLRRAKELLILGALTYKYPVGENSNILIIGDDISKLFISQLKGKFNVTVMNKSPEDDISIMYNAIILLDYIPSDISLLYKILNDEGVLLGVNIDGNYVKESMKDKGSITNGVVAIDWDIQDIPFVDIKYRFNPESSKLNQQVFYLQDFERFKPERVERLSTILNSTKISSESHLFFDPSADINITIPPKQSWYADLCTYFVFKL